MTATATDAHAYNREAPLEPYLVASTAVADLTKSDSNTVLRQVRPFEYFPAKGHALRFAKPANVVLSLGATDNSGLTLHVRGATRIDLAEVPDRAPPSSVSPSPLIPRITVNAGATLTIVSSTDSNIELEIDGYIILFYGRASEFQLKPTGPGTYQGAWILTANLMTSTQAIVNHFASGTEVRLNRGVFVLEGAQTEQRGSISNMPSALLPPEEDTSWRANIPAMFGGADAIATIARVGRRTQAIGIEPFLDKALRLDVEYQFAVPILLVTRDGHQIRMAARTRFTFLPARTNVPAGLLRIEPTHEAYDRTPKGTKVDEKPTDGVTIAVRPGPNTKRDDPTTGLRVSIGTKNHVGPADVATFLGEGELGLKTRLSEGFRAGTVVADAGHVLWKSVVGNPAGSGPMATAWTSRKATAFSPDRALWALVDANPAQAMDQFRATVGGQSSQQAPQYYPSVWLGTEFLPPASALKYMKTEGSGGPKPRQPPRPR